MNALVVNCSPVRAGATAAIARLITGHLAEKYDTRTVCIDDFHIEFCRGCRSCHSTASCMIQDDVGSLMTEFERADVLVCVSPSYWADVPGQFKAFIDRCTPWCDTHEPHASLSQGKRGYAVALRTGPGILECERILDTIGHFYGHLKIPCLGRLSLCSIECKEDVASRRSDILAFCEKFLSSDPDL